MSKLDDLEEIAAQMGYWPNKGQCVRSSPSRAKPASAAPDSPPAALSPPEAIPAQPLQQSWTVTSRDELHEMCCDRQDQLNISNETIDALAGLADGHASKLLGPSRTKSLGPISLPLMLRALALKIVKVEFAVDPDAVAVMRGRWTPRGPSGPRRKRPE